MFASQVKGQVVIPSSGPDEVDVIVYIRKLSARSLEKAREAKLGESFNIAKKMGADLVKAFNSQEVTEAALARNAAKEKGERPEDKYDGYDRFTVLKSGIDHWSLTDKDPKLDSVLDDLDEESVERIFRAIIDLSVKKPAEITQTEKNV